MDARGNHRGILVATVLVLLLSACGPKESPADAAGPWIGTITTAGNVTTVVNESGSVWGGTAILVEEASIGVESGEDAYMFGSLAGVAASDDRIYVLDRQVPALRMYDLDGGHLGDIGSIGSGPGEYRRPDGLGVADDGRLFVRDASQARVLIYSAEGVALETWSLQKTVRSFLPMAVTRDGAFFDPVGVESANDIMNWKWGMQRFGHEGPVGPSIPVPDFAFRPAQLEARSGGRMMAMDIPFYPSLLWVLGPTGAMVAGTSDDYRYEVHDAGGDVTIVLRAWERVPAPEEEVQLAEKRAYDTFRELDPNWSWNGPAIPDHMPAYSLLLPDRDGRVWVQSIVGTRRVPDCGPEAGRSCWVAVHAVDVFGADGRYLGAVEPPPSFHLSLQTFIAGSTVVGATTAEAGTIVVKRYRLVLPGEEEH